MSAGVESMGVDPFALAGPEAEVIWGEIQQVATRRDQLVFTYLSCWIAAVTTAAIFAALLTG